MAAVAAEGAAEEAEPEEDGETPSIVLDSGSGRLRVGFNGDERPLVEAASLIARRGSYVGGSGPEVLIGEAALGVGPQPRLALTQPVQRGIVADWRDAELLWRHAIETGLGADPTRHPVLLAEPPLNPKGNREAAAQCLFESLGAPAAYVANASTLALYASGRGCGVVLNCGEGVSSAEIIYQGYAIPASSRRMDLAGADVTDAVRGVLRRRGCCLETPLEWQLARQLKEQLFRVREHPEAGGDTEAEGEDVEEEFQLPDGRGVVSLSRRDRSSASDVLFNSSPASLSPSSQPSLQSLVADAVSAADIDVRLDVWSNVILAGGCSAAPGFAGRLSAELLLLRTAAARGQAAHTVRRRLRLVPLPEPERAVWLGGSILASLSTFQAMWISREEYEECGPRIMHRRCY